MDILVLVVSPIVFIAAIYMCINAVISMWTEYRNKEF
jgi:hypothetical protein